MVFGHKKHINELRKRDTHNRGKEQHEKEMKEAALVIAELKGQKQGHKHQEIIERVKAVIFGAGQNRYPEDIKSIDDVVLTSFSVKVPLQDNLTDGGLHVLHILRVFLKESKRMLSIVMPANDHSRPEWKEEEIDSLDEPMGQWYSAVGDAIEYSQTIFEERLKVKLDPVLKQEMMKEAFERVGINQFIQQYAADYPEIEVTDTKYPVEAEDMGIFVKKRARRVRKSKSKTPPPATRRRLKKMPAEETDGNTSSAHLYVT